MAKQTYQVGKNQIYGLYLIFHRNGDVRLTRRYPSLDRDERCVSLQATLPLALFEVPTLKASLTVDALATEIPPIDLSVAGEALGRALGVDVDLRITDHGQE